MFPNYQEHIFKSFLHHGYELWLNLVSEVEVTADEFAQAQYSTLFADLLSTADYIAVLSPHLVFTREARFSDLFDKNNHSYLITTPTAPPSSLRMQLNKIIGLEESELSVLTSTDVINIYPRFSFAMTRSRIRFVNRVSVLHFFHCQEAGFFCSVELIGYWLVSFARGGGSGVAHLDLQRNEAQRLISLTNETNSVNKSSLPLWFLQRECFLRRSNETTSCAVKSRLCHIGVGVGCVDVSDTRKPVCSACGPDNITCGGVVAP